MLTTLTTGESGILQLTRYLTKKTELIPELGFSWSIAAQKVSKIPSKFTAVKHVNKQT